MYVGCCPAILGSDQGGCRYNRHSLGHDLRRRGLFGSLHRQNNADNQQDGENTNNCYDFETYGGNADKAHIRGFCLQPAADVGFKVIAVIAAVPEYFRDFDFVSATNRRLRGDHANKVRAFLKLPFL